MVNCPIDISTTVKMFRQTFFEYRSKEIPIPLQPYEVQQVKPFRLGHITCEISQVRLSVTDL